MPGAVAAYNSQVFLTSQPSIALTNEAMTDSGDHKTYTITNQAKRFLDKSVATGVQTSPDGTTWTTVTTGFALSRCNARVVFAVANAPTLSVRLSSGAYFVVSLLAEAANCDVSPKMETTETTTFNSTGTKSFVPTLLTGTMKTNTFWVSPVRSQSLIARDLLACSFQASTGNHYDGYAYASDCNIKTDPKAAVVQDLQFQLTDEFFAA